MAKKKRNYKLITFKVFYEADADIIDWWMGIEMGERSNVLRDLIRESMSMQSTRKTTSITSIPELIEVQQDTRWIVDALNDMPAYLERVIHQVASLQPAINQQARAPDETVRQSEESLDDKQVSRREQRMRKATW
jgi:hypothetical protein